MIGNKFVRGSKYYRYLDDNTIEIIRINKEKGTEYSVYNENIKEYEKKTYQDIKDNYILLTPDGYMTFMIVTMQSTKDVLVVFHRKEDIDGKENIPYAVCRQFMDDIFANMILKNDIHAVGVSISRETCPKDVDFKMTMICDTVEKQYIVAVYVDDKIEDTLKYINNTPFNDELSNIYNLNSNNKKLIGLCKDIKELLLVNNFMYDVYSGYNIIQIPFSIDPEFTGTFTNMDIVKYLENITQSKITNTYVLKFSKDINLREIKKKFIIISDKFENLFVVAYDVEEDFEMTYESVNNKLRMSQEKCKFYNVNA